MFSVILLLFFIGFLTTLLVSLKSLWESRITLRELVRSRFYEAAPIRGVAWMVLILIGETTLFSVLAVVTKIQVLYYQKQLFSTSAVTLLPYVIAAVLLGLLCKLIWLRLVKIPYPTPSEVDVRIATVRSNIPASELAILGRGYRQYLKVKKVSDPIAAYLKSSVTYLAGILQHPDFQLPALDQHALSQRISQGCANIQNKSIFFPRHLKRLMDLVEIEYQDFAVAMLRYLIVNRYVRLSTGVGTSAGRRHPQVAVWDFPIRKPDSRVNDGFVDWLDSVTLDKEWDVVQTCKGHCHGTGQVWIMETYYETEHYTEHGMDSHGHPTSHPACRQVAKTRQIAVICSTCNGCGRTLHHQILNTQWRYLIPKVTEPEIPVPELVENAEEVKFFRLPLTVDLNSDLFPPETFGIHNQIVNQMNKTGQDLVSMHERQRRLVLSRTGDKLYQADFQICGFRTIRIQFQKLGGRIGWFFGKRLEFYFPNPPVSYSTIGTWVFLPPLLLAVMIAVKEWCMHTIVPQLNPRREPPSQIK